jgi:hypothetical protein
MAAQPQATAPIIVSAQLDASLSRWRWLIKWILVLPHLLVLAALWFAFMALTLVAGISIALTGQYPRQIFDFNVGVLRWTWRVELYAFALTTDRYPPFTLDADPTFPGDLEVTYAPELSRRLVWVKWWLLALPHYLIVAVLTGGFAPHVAGGLLGVLGLVAGVLLAVRGRYPQSLFDLVIGLHRWIWRVAVYAALMRDEYPPFRLDMGPAEPTGLASSLPPPRPRHGPSAVAP